MEQAHECKTEYKFNPGDLVRISNPHPRFHSVPLFKKVGTLLRIREAYIDSAYMPGEGYCGPMYSVYRDNQRQKFMEKELILVKRAI